MAKHTNLVSLTTSWAIVSNAKATAILSPQMNGLVEYALVDSLADIAPGDPGHAMPSIFKNQGAFTLNGLGTKHVVARTNAAGVAAGLKLLVTAF